jgi:hypothetical protein
MIEASEALINALPNKANSIIVIKIPTLRFYMKIS